MEETHISKSCRAVNTERKGKDSPLNEMKLQIWSASLNEYPKKIFVHEKRDNY